MRASKHGYTIMPPVKHGDLSHYALWRRISRLLFWGVVAVLFTVGVVGWSRAFAAPPDLVCDGRSYVWDSNGAGTFVSRSRHCRDVGTAFSDELRKAGQDQYAWGYPHGVYGCLDIGAMGLLPLTGSYAYELYFYIGDPQEFHTTYTVSNLCAPRDDVETFTDGMTLGWIVATALVGIAALKLMLRAAR